MKKSRISGAALAAILLIAAASIPQAAGLADAFTLTVYEQSGAINAYTFQSSDPLLYAKRTGYPGPANWGGSGGARYHLMILRSSRAWARLRGMTGPPFPPMRSL